MTDEVGTKQLEDEIRKEEEKVVPYWKRLETYRKMWRGTFIDNLILKGDDEEEQRIQKLRDILLKKPSGKAGIISIWRAKLMTKSYKKTEGDAPVLRKAKAFKYVCQHIPIPYTKYDLLLGHSSANLHGTEIEPEFFSAWLEREIFVKEANKKMTQLEALKFSGSEGFDLGWVVSDEDIKLLKEDILPYWRGKCLEHIVQKHLDENFSVAKFKQGDFAGRVSHPLIGHGLSHTIVDYSSVLKKGLKGLKEEIQREMEKIDASDVPSSTELDRVNFYKAMLIAADGIIIYANRCAELAEELAVKETDIKRKAELVEMGRICRKVPKKAAESCWEALQSWHFLHNALYLCDGGTVHCSGRFDQYMYPYLKNDLESGKITKKFAQALLEHLFLKIGQGRYLRVKIPATSKQDKIVISGVDSDGHDATNEISFMVLEAIAHTHLEDPIVSVRVHKDTPDNLLRATLEVLRGSGGLPMIVNDEAIIPSLMGRGVSLIDARNYADMGCQECATDPNITGADTKNRGNAGYFNLVKPIELALYNDVNKMTGEEGGVKTGDPRNFKSMKEFFAAVKEQIEHAVYINCIVNNLIVWTFVNSHPVPVINLLTPGPMKKGMDIMSGACKYNWYGAIGVGLGTAADTLAAIEWLVYDKKEATFDELLKALDNNWVGYEDIREKCRKAPKYGKDDDYADKWAVKISKVWMDAYEKHRAAHGGVFVGGFFSMTNYVPMGAETWATPDGRKKGDPLSSAIDPSNGVELEGPTKLHKSAAKIDSWRTTNGLLFNCKLPTSAVADERKLAKWADLVRTFILLRGQSVQYTVVDEESLKAAQKDPDKYRDITRYHYFEG